MPKAALILALLLHSLYSGAQDSTRLATLEKNIESAQTDAIKITALAKLAEYYSVFNLGRESDSVLQEALTVAEVSEERGPVIRLMLDNTFSNLHFWSGAESFRRSFAIMKTGIQYAEDAHNDKLEALGYMKLAGIYRQKNLFNEAVENTSKATTALEDTKHSDSERIDLFIELGDIYLAKTDAVAAYKNYNTAFEIAHRSKNVQGESDAYHRFSNLYNSFNDSLAATNFLLESSRLNIANHNLEGQFHDNIDLAKITDSRDYIEKAEQIAEKMNSDAHRMSAKRLMYYWDMVKGKNCAETFKFLRENPVVAQYIKNMGPDEYKWETGLIYNYGGRFDSALYYFNNAQAGLIASGNESKICDVYSTFGAAYLQAGDSVQAENYYEKAFLLAKDLRQFLAIDSIATNLSILNANHKNFSRAYPATSSASVA